MMVSRAKQRNTSVVNEPAAIKLHLGDSARQRICPCARSNKAARDRVRQNSARSLRTNVPGSRSHCVLSRSDSGAATSSAGMSPSILSLLIKQPATASTSCVCDARHSHGAGEGAAAHSTAYLQQRPRRVCASGCRWWGALAPRLCFSSQVMCP